MEPSILLSTKKQLGLDATYTAFDQDVLVCINSAFSSLNQLGVGDPLGEIIEDEATEWDDLSLDDMALSLVKVYIFLKVRMLFDTPTTSFMIQAIENQLKEHEWRLVNVHDSTAATTYAEEVTP